MKNHCYVKIIKKTNKKEFLQEKYIFSLRI